MAAIAESHRASEPAFKQTVAAIAKSARTSEFKDTGELSMADEAEETDWKGARTRGTRAFAKGDFSAADAEFRLAIARLCPVILGDGDASKGDGIDEVPDYEYWTRKSAAELVCCRAAALLRMRRHLEALDQAELALELAPTWAKPAMQVAKCRFGLRQYDKAIKATEHESLKAPPELAAAARALRETIEKKAYGAVVSDGAPAKPLKKAPPGATQTFVSEPGEWDAALVLPDKAKDMLADILARCDDDDAQELLAAARAKVAADGEATRDDVMCPLMIQLQSDVLHGDYGYPPGEAGVAQFGAEMRKSMAGFPDDREFANLVRDLTRVAAPPDGDGALYGGM